MSSRLHSPSDARVQIIRVAGDLFHRLGVRRTTATEVIEAAGIAKTEFRQHFKNKAELASAVLRYYFEGLAAGIGPVKYELDSWDDLQECLRSHLDLQKRFRMTRSCPIGTLGNELKEGDELTRQALCLILELMLARLESFFSREKIAGRLSSAADVEQLANFSVATIQGAMLTGKIRRNSRSVETVLEDLLSHLKLYQRRSAAPRKRLGRNCHPNGAFMAAKLPAPPPVAKSAESSTPGHSAPNLSVEE